MGNFGCCQGKPETIDSTPPALPLEPKSSEIMQPEVEKTNFEFEEPIKLVESPPKAKKRKKSRSKKEERKSSKKLDKPEKPREPEKPKDLEKPKETENPRYSREVFVQHKKAPVESQYTIISLLGKGSFGFVYKAKHKYSESFRAVKVLKKESLDQNSAKKLMHEVEILKSLDHPNIIKIFEVFEDQNSINLITELCTGGELFDRIVASKGFSENKAAFYLYQIMSAVIACHDKGIVHRDLKPENILFIDNSENSLLKVIDFGTSRKLEHNTTLSSLTGTVVYS